jgi:hypothetical protein
MGEGRGLLRSFRMLGDPFAEGQPLHGFKPLDRDALASRRARPLLLKLAVKRSDAHLFQVGELTDGRWAVVGCTKKWVRGAIEGAQIRRLLRHDPGPLTPVEPLPEAEARAILLRLFRGLSWEDLVPNEQSDVAP